MRRPAPPSGGTPPPAEASLGESTVNLVALADEVCRRYRAAFPDEEERYGDAGDAWCRHDNRWLLAWAFLDARDDRGVLDENARWLARVLAARGFPVARLARDLEIAAEVVSERLGAEECAALLRRAAGVVVAPR